MIYNYNDFVKLVFFRKFIPKKIRSYLSEKLRKFYGTNLIDKQLLEYLNYNDGFFIELGAHDGLTESNTKYYEKFKNWKGLLIEPSIKFRDLTKNRSSKNFFSNSCCSSFENKGKVIEFLFRDTMTVTFELDNQLKGDLKEDYLEIAEKHKKNNINKFKIKTTTLNDLMDEFKCPKIIDLLSLDTEGTELEVLKGINFQKYKFRFIVVENRNFNELEFFFKTKNYSFTKKLSHHDYLFKSN